jgi:hypothetical protein
MKRNMSTLDRVIRYVPAILFFILYISGAVTGVFGIILFALGGILIVTSLISFCPLYTLLGRRTLKAHGH